MVFKQNEAMEVLERTPLVLEQMLGGLSSDWVMNSEGPETWCPYDVLGHLIHGEKTDWMARLDIILGNGNKKFTPYDRFAQFNESKGKTMGQLLTEFKQLRKLNMTILKSKHIKEEDFGKTGIHPAFGEVTLKHLLSTWVAHDLSHINQISRVMAKQYKTEVGPWVAYLSVMNK